MRRGHHADTVAGRCASAIRSADREAAGLAIRDGAEMKRGGTMRTFSKVALACVLFFAMAGTAMGAEAKASARVSHVAASSAVYAVAAASDDDIPGVGAPASPITGTLDENTDWSDVYRVWLNAGQTLSVSMSGAAGTDFDIYLYAPNATSVDVDDSVAESEWGRLSGDVRLPRTVLGLLLPRGLRLQRRRSLLDELHDHPGFDGEAGLALLQPEERLALLHRDAERVQLGAGQPERDLRTTRARRTRSTPSTR